MKGILKYMRWLWSHSVGARGAILVNILLGSLNVGLNLLFIFLCKRLVDIATGVEAGNLGVYTAKTAEYRGLTVEVNQFFEQGFSIELKSGGKCKLTADGESASGKWTLEGTKFHVNGGGIDCDGTLENGVIRLDYDGVVFNMVNEDYVAPTAEAILR